MSTAPQREEDLSPAAFNKMRELLAAAEARIERMEAVVEAALRCRDSDWHHDEMVHLEIALSTYEAIARGEISPDEAPLVDPEDE